MIDIREADWKRLRQLHPIALDRLCQKALSEIQEQCARTDNSPHERYLSVYSTVEKRDRQVARIFNDLRRSNGLSRLALMVSHGLINAEELASFSSEAQSEVGMLTGRQRVAQPSVPPDVPAAASRRQGRG